jgi:hypothetical protein
MATAAVTAIRNSPPDNRNIAAAGNEILLRDEV